MTSEKKGIPSLNTMLSKLTRRSETTSDSTPPSPVVGLRKAASGTDMASTTPNPLLTPFDRKKAAAVGLRRWVRFESNGTTDILQADKHAITQKLGVQLRDLRLLDPQLHFSYPSALLCRDKALVVNLEHIKCIITKDEVFILNADEDPVVAFIEELQRRLTPVNGKALPLPTSKSSPNLAHDGAGGLPPAAMDDMRGEHKSPFELRALEVALDVVASQLERLAVELECAAHPALDDLTAKVSTGNLERVRRIKNRLVRLTTRVQTLREMLEKLMDDDSDMHAMHLTARAYDQLERQKTQQSGFDNALIREQLMAGGAPLSPKNLDEQAERDEEEIAEVEMILETYFMSVDNTFNKLQTLCEYIDDTEDYINIELDNHRNQLIRLELILTAATLCIAIVGVISGLFGMNLHNTHEDSYLTFVLVSCLSSAFAVLLFIGIVVFCRWKKLF
ncbi:g7755 [Coccomyxa viridis]|uniref:Magnesium transporter n=1 Tax=Coccomyxa viridis TaxID=1274662 RepID=A0ABP1FYM3_9CHLO